MTHNVTFTTMTTALSGFAGAVLATLVFGPKAEARTPITLVTNCPVLTENFEGSDRCHVTQDGGGGYIIDTQNNGQFYINQTADEFYLNGLKCEQPVFSPPAGEVVSAFCMSEPGVPSVTAPVK